MKQFIKRIILFIAAVFLFPAFASAAWWSSLDRPASWRDADWTSSRLLPDGTAIDEPVIHILSARAGGLKGAVAVHSWIVIGKPSATQYDRYDKVGWGRPIRKNAYSADARWYSNEPWIVATVKGNAAARLIPAVEAAIARYPYAAQGAYTVWPGPNSNSFIDYVLRSVPELGVALPPNAVGRDYRPGLIAFDHTPDWSDVHLSFGGLAGFAAGARSGLELHFLGLVAGFDIARPALKVPGFGRLPLI